MGFALTLIYIVLTLVSPSQFGQAFADYHLMAYLAGIAILASFSSILDNIRYRSAVQTRLLVGFMVAVIVSEVATGWFGGAVKALLDILPSAAVFFLIIATVTTPRRLRIVIWITIGTCLCLTVEALCGYYTGFRGDTFVFLQGGLPRLRAVGFLNDPNDLSQMLLIALSLMFSIWEQGRVIFDSFIVLAPAGLLFWAVYLTHSRGALVALGVLASIALRNKVGHIPSILLAGLFLFGMKALNFTGGRGVSATDGSDRLELWAQGLELFKRAPLFGIGFGRFADFSVLTAHNSFVLCLAELGFVGSTIFVALLVTTLMDLNGIINVQGQSTTPRDSLLDLESVDRPASPEWETSSYEPAITAATIVDCDLSTTVEGDEEAFAPKPVAMSMQLALISFIVTSFFLSRSYSTTMFLILGLATATIALDRDTANADDLRRRLLVTLVVEFSAILVIYCAVRFRH
jgi:O-antigen ligase